MRTTFLYFAIMVSLINYDATFAQIPPPIDLKIDNIPQETTVWCWVAVAQQIIYSLRGPEGTPPQCGLVAIASNIHPNYCCQFPSPCMRTGYLPEIQALILRFGGKFSTVAPPTDPMTIYNTLASNHAIIMAVQSSPYSYHVVVIRGMEWVATPMGVQPILFINDPMGHFTQRVPYINILPYWHSAIIVHL